MDQSDDLARRARAATELLRPHPHRGDLIAAGAVPFTVALLLINLRLDGPWGSGAFLVVDLLAVALVLGMGVLAPIEEARPRAYQVTLQLCGLVLLFVFLLRLAQLLGADDPIGSSGNAFWILAVVTGAAIWLVRERRSALCALAGGITGIFAVLAFVDWVFNPSGPGTTRWMLLLVALGLLTAALVLRDRRRSESVFLIDAAGFAILLLGLTWLGELAFGVMVFGQDKGFTGGPGAGWKIVLLAAGLGLIAYAGVDQEPGPGYLGVLILLVFVLLVGAPGEGGPSLWFWPAALLLVGGAMIGAGLRPREPLPPEPGAAGAPAAPVPGPFAARAEPAGPGAAPAALAAPGAASAAPGTGPAAPGTAPAAPGTAPAAPGTAPAGPGAASAAPAPPERASAEPPAAGEAPAPAASDPPAAAEPLAPEPPASGSLWARADQGEEPTRQHPAVRPGDDRPSDDDAPTEVRPPKPS